MIDQPFELCGAPAALEFEERTGLIFLSVGVHEFPMTRDEAVLLANRLKALEAHCATAERLVAL